MGVLNVTPDSFSDGGLFFDKEKAIAHGLRMVEEGQISSILEGNQPGRGQTTSDRTKNFVGSFL